jgi:hypothetical protein
MEIKAQQKEDVHKEGQCCRLKAEQKNKVRIVEKLQKEAEKAQQAIDARARETPRQS